jgi:hypothetical protein
MWLMKRAIVDGWDTDKAMAEAIDLGLTNESLKQFFTEQIKQRKR